MKKIEIIGTELGNTWTLQNNGDCISEYNVFYNVFTNESNLKVFPQIVANRLKKEFRN